MADVLERLSDDVIGAVRGYVARSVTPLLARLEALEKRVPEKGEPGLPGKDGESISLAVLSGEIAAAVSRVVEALPKPTNGKDFDPLMLEDAVRRHVAALPKPKDGEKGKDADSKAIAAEVMLQVSEMLDTIPVPKDGADGVPGEKGERGDQGEKGDAGLDGKDGSQGEKGDAGRDGKDGVQGAAGQPGKPGDRGEPGAKGDQGTEGRQGEKGEPGLIGKDGAPGLDGAHGERGEKGDPGLQGKDGAAGIDGRDGADGVSGKDADPEMVAALVTRAVDEALPGLVAKAIDAATPGIVERAVARMPPPEAGRDGRDADPEIMRTQIIEELAKLPPPLPGKDAHPDTVRYEIAKQLVNIPKGDDGKAGKDGRDGFSEVVFEMVDDRTLTFGLKSGDREELKTIKLPIPIDRGVYKVGRYERGDGVTYGGSYWLAQRDTDQAPASGSDWRLAVKKGRDLERDRERDRE